MCMLVSAHPALSQHWHHQAVIHNVHARMHGLLVNVNHAGHLDNLGTRSTHHGTAHNGNGKEIAEKCMQQCTHDGACAYMSHTH